MKMALAPASRKVENFMGLTLASFG